MAEKQLQLAVNGQQFQQADVNLLGTTSGLADDRVLAELLQMTPFDGSTVSKGVLPPASSAMVAPNGASGSVIINPFRAFIGSRTAVGTEAQQNVRDIRSCLSVAEGATSKTTTLNLTANASGNPRWDLVYASVAVDGNSATVTRKVKDTVTKVVAATSVVLTKVQTMTLAVVDGTPGASPAFPTIPADAGSTYYVPLAFVRVPDGFGAGSTVSKADINTVATVLSVARSAGGAQVRPANQNNVPGGVGISSAGTSLSNGILAWTGTAGTRPAVYLPPTMSGSESLLIPIDLCDGSSANWSHTDGSLVDDSRDWRNRVFRWMAAIGKTGGQAGRFPWATAAAGSLFTPWALAGGPTIAAAPMPGYASSSSFATVVSGMGSSFGTGGSQSLVALLGASGAGATAAPANGYNVATNALVTATGVGLSVEDSTGHLIARVIGVPFVSVFFWLEASAPFENGKL